MMAAEMLHGLSLVDLLQGFAGVDGVPDRRPSGVCLDSRRIRPGDLFLACAGSRGHGRDYIDQALRAGAVAVAVEGEGSATLCGGAVPLIPVPQLSAKAGLIAARFYGHPSRALAVVGVTGTNGKTSVTQFLAQALEAIPGYGPCGVVGTLGYGLHGRLVEPETTTPDPVTLQRLLAEFRGQGARCAVLEVSSHALEQHRVAGVESRVAVFTNLSRDHLDYHRSMAEYAAAKQRLFRDPGLGAAVINLDDPYGADMVAAVADGVTVTGYSLGAAAAQTLPRVNHWVRARAERNAQGNLVLDLDSYAGAAVVETALIGRINGYNLLAVLATLLELGIAFRDAAASLGGLRGVPGRLESFGGGTEGPRVVVDYAHTPDALRQALLELRPLAAGRLICVFGCGGDRDQGKRPQMGQVAEDLADEVVLTDDNPRYEDPRAIVAQILEGMRRPGAVQVEHDRRAAIAGALAGAEPGDLVLVAGKGHEPYQEVMGRRSPLSDRALVAELLEGGRR